MGIKEFLSKICLYKINRLQPFHQIIYLSLYVVPHIWQLLKPKNPGYRIMFEEIRTPLIERGL